MIRRPSSPLLERHVSIEDAAVPKHFRRFVRDIDRVPHVEDAALLVDHVFHPELDMDACVEQLEQLAGAYGSRISSEFDDDRRLEILGRYMGRELGFRGDRSDFTNPKNSFMHHVLQSRRGLPITLSAIYLGVARRAGVPLHGIGLPGHFIVGNPAREPVMFLDPFRMGRTLSHGACDQIVRQVTQGEVESATRFLKPTGTRSFLTRMLNNLQMVYWNRRDNIRGLLAARLLCVLNPGAAEHRKARAYFYDRLERPHDALADYESYLLHHPSAPDATRVQKRVAHLRAVTGRRS
jgi:regulator of sirC expression with transglutaminase-like and TPR domain